MQFVLIVHNRTPNCFRATALRRRNGRVFVLGFQRHAARRTNRADEPADVFYSSDVPYAVPPNL